MHLDTLTGLEEVKICKAYEIDGNRTTSFAANTARLSRVEAVYEILPGWQQDVTGVNMTGKPVTIIGVGPKRSQTIFR